MNLQVHKTSQTPAGESFTTGRACVRACVQLGLEPWPLRMLSQRSIYHGAKLSAVEYFLKN